MKKLKTKSKYLLLLLIPGLIFLFSNVKANDVINVTSNAELVDILAKAYRAGVDDVIIKYNVKGGASIEELADLQTQAMKKAGAYYEKKYNCSNSGVGGIDNQFHFYIGCEADTDKMEYVANYAKIKSKEFYAKTQDKGELVKLVYNMVKNEYSFSAESTEKPSVYDSIKNKKAHFYFTQFLVARILSELDIDTVYIAGDNANMKTIWLMVEINGNWYHLDTTEDMFSKSEQRFLKSDNTMISLGYVWDITSNPRSSNDFTTAVKESTVLSTTTYEKKLETVTIVENNTEIVPEENPADGTSSWATSGVENAIAAGIVPLELQKNYQTAITREQFASLVVRLYEELYGATIEVPSAPFTDINDDNVSKAYALGIVSGVGNNKFAPSNKITREQITVMFNNTLKALNINPNVSSTYIMFADEAEISSWAKDSVQTLYKLEIMSGVGGNRINPKGTATIEQAILLGNKLYNQYK